MLRQLIYQILLYQAAGMAASMGFVRPSQVGGRYYLYHGLGLLGVAALAVWAAPDSPALLSLLLPANPTPAMLTNGVLSALTLGFVMHAMWLGHWYLTQPKLSINELKRVTIFMTAIIAVRFVFGTYMIWPLFEGKTELELYRYFFGGVPGLFVLMRWLWGLLGPLVLSWFILQTVKIRSTQSATGLLYVAVLIVITGEILSLYLALYHGIAC